MGSKSRILKMSTPAPNRPRSARTPHSAGSAQLGFERSGDLAVAVDRDEVDAVKRVRVANVSYKLDGQIDTGVGVGVESVEDGAGNGELRNVGADLAGHAGGGQRHDAG